MVRPTTDYAVSGVYDDIWGDHLPGLAFHFSCHVVELVLPDDDLVSFSYSCADGRGILNLFPPGRVPHSVEE